MRSIITVKICCKLIKEKPVKSLPIHVATDKFILWIQQQSVNLKQAAKFVALTFISISFLNYFLSPFSLYHTLSSSSSTSSPFPPHLIIPLYKYSFSVVTFLNHLVLCALDIIVAHYCSTCFLYLKHMSHITIYNNVACPSLLDA